MLVVDELVSMAGDTRGERCFLVPSVWTSHPVLGLATWKKAPPSFLVVWPLLLRLLRTTVRRRECNQKRQECDLLAINLIVRSQAGQDAAGGANMDRLNIGQSFG